MNEGQEQGEGQDFSNLQASQPNRVDADQIPPEVLALLQAAQDSMMGSGYVARIKELRPLVVGKKVVGATAGPAGFALCFDDDSWAAAVLADGVVDWKAGAKASARELRDLAEGVEGRLPGIVSGPIEGQMNPFFGMAIDLQAQVTEAIGHEVTGLAIGSDCFSFRFEDGHELETFVAKLPDGRVGYTVVWVQW